MDFDVGEIRFFCATFEHQSSDNLYHFPQLFLAVNLHNFRISIINGIAQHPDSRIQLPNDQQHKLL